MKNIIIFSSFIVFTFISQQIQAQQIGMNISVFDAKGEFSQNIDRMPVGLSVNYLHGLNQSEKIKIGAEVGVAMYSNTSYYVDDTRGNSVSIFEEDCFWNLFVMAQYQLYRTPMVAAYAEGRVGVSTFFSSKMAEEENAFFEDEFEFHGTAFNTGVGGGVQINLSGLFSGDPMEKNNLWLDMAATINSGTKSKYRNAGESNISLEEAEYESLTNNVNYRIGVNFKF